MKKRVFGRRLKRDIRQRKALFRSLMGGLIVHGRIRTTKAKAKAAKGEVEKLVTKALKKGESARSYLLKRLVRQDIVDKLIVDIAPRFSLRPGGYTRIIKLGPRLKDNAPMVLLEWVEPSVASSQQIEVPTKRVEKKESSPKESRQKEEKKKQGKEKRTGEGRKKLGKKKIKQGV